MLLSMTGFGEAHAQAGPVAVAIEVRAVNSRYFKLSLRASEGYGSLETQIEAAVRQRIKRGTMQINLRVDRQATPDDFRINEVVLASYREQLARVEGRLARTEPCRLDTLLALPGVVDEQRARTGHVEENWPLIERTLNDAIDRLTAMREQEGRAMADDLTANCREVAEHLAAVEARAPGVVEAYRGRLTERVGRLLAEQGVSVTQADLVREVALFAERTDIAEEIVRLKSHLAQFASFMAMSESTGRKLEFLIQEMNRETNTIGSKANDADLARHVVEIKAALERMREMVQNVE